MTTTTTTTTEQLTHWMRHDPTFAGVFPLNGIPHLPSSNKSCSFIVNTHTDNLPGQHWIAVRIVYDQAWIFDPLASLPAPSALCHHLLAHCHIRVLHVSPVSVQPANSLSCGQHCVYFLCTGAPALSEKSVHLFISKL
jgi:hypothetical protein